MTVTCRHPDFSGKLLFEWKLGRSGLLEIVRETSNKSNILTCVEFDATGNIARYCSMDRNFDYHGVERTYENLLLKTEKRFKNGYFKLKLL
jgi:hypothetical protein